MPSIYEQTCPIRGDGCHGDNCKLWDEVDEDCSLVLNAGAASFLCNIQYDLLEPIKEAICKPAPIQAVYPRRAR